MNRTQLESVTALNRNALGVGYPTERMVHIGLGAFFRAHQAWYTAKAAPNGDWGYVAFTGRNAAAADLLESQDGLYTLITRGTNGDQFEIIDVLARAEDGNNLVELTKALVSQQTAVVTLTITEAGYPVDANGRLIDSHALLASLAEGKPTTAMTRLAWGLNQRRLANGLGLALVPCDNIPANGKLLAAAMTQLFAAFGQQAVDWLTASVSFVSTSIDRITPRTTESDIQVVQDQTGYHDVSPVVTEPFSDWVLEGRFPLGRPAWERAGARFVDHIEPFENRKLWMLNGSHSLLAYLGQLRGQSTVSQAIGDPVCLAAVEQFWDEAERTLNNPALELRAYRQALLERFGNPRIAHQLAQIGIDGATKVRVRVIPTLKSELAAGRPAAGAIGVIAAWITYVIANPATQDSRAAELAQALDLAAGDTNAAVRNLLALLDPAAADNQDLLEQVTARVFELQKSAKETA